MLTCCLPTPGSTRRHATNNSEEKADTTPLKGFKENGDNQLQQIDECSVQDSTSSTLVETKTESEDGFPTARFLDESVDSLGDENVPQLLSRPKINREELVGGFTLKIANWNLLADGLTGLYGNNKKKAFAYLPHCYLEADYRVPLMIKEIKQMNADVIVFEEFDLYSNAEFMAEMSSLGYAEGARQVKLWSPCVGISPELPPDGIAVFFKQEKFLENPTVSFTEQEAHKRWLADQIQRDEIKADESGCISVVSLIQGQAESDRPRMFAVIDAEVKNGNIDDPYFFDRDPATKPVLFDKFLEWCNSAIPPPSAAIRLVPKSRPDLAICVIGTHLVSAKKESGERQRLSEMQFLLSHPNHEETKKDAHVFLCCDMNATCNDAMGYPPLTYNWVMENRNGLKSALRQEEELEWTSWKKRIGKDGSAQILKYSVDFVFCPDDDLWRVIDILGLPSDEECADSVQRMMSEHGNLEGEPAPLPGKNYPSDHLAVCATIEFVG